MNLGEEEKSIKLKALKSDGKLKIWLNFSFHSTYDCIPNHEQWEKQRAFLVVSNHPEWEEEKVKKSWLKFVVLGKSFLKSQQEVFFYNFHFHSDSA